MLKIPSSIQTSAKKEGTTDHISGARQGAENYWENEGCNEIHENSSFQAIIVLKAAV